MANPLAKLWVGTCTVSTYQDTLDATTYQTTKSLSTLVTNEPCRVSFSKETTTDVTTGVAITNQVIKLFIRPNLTIPAGSVIEVTQNGRTTKYKRGSTSALYSNHQEIILELFEDKA